MDKSQIPSRYCYWARSSFDRSHKHMEIADEFPFMTSPSSSYHRELAARYMRASWYFIFIDEFYKTEQQNER